MLKTTRQTAIDAPATADHLRVDMAVEGLLRACATHYNVLPRLVRIAYGSRDHDTFDCGLWCRYLDALQAALFETSPHTLPPCVLVAYLNVMIAQLEVQS